MKKSKLKQLIKEEINKTINKSNLDSIKSKAIRDIELIKAKANSLNDWGLLDDIKTQTEKIRNSTSIEQIKKIVNWLQGGESEPLDKISESQLPSKEEQLNFFKKMENRRKERKELMKKLGIN